MFSIISNDTKSVTYTLNNIETTGETDGLVHGAKGMMMGSMSVSNMLSREERQHYQQQINDNTFQNSREKFR